MRCACSEVELAEPRTVTYRYKDRTYHTAHRCWPEAPTCTVCGERFVEHETYWTTRSGPHHIRCGTGLAGSKD